MITQNLNLAAFEHYLMTTKKGTECVVIPLERNHIVKGEKNSGLHVNFVHFEMKEQKEWATHITKQSLPKKVREKMTKEEKQAMPIMGNLLVDNSPPAATDNNVAPGGPVNEGEEPDNLPF